MTDAGNYIRLTRHVIETAGCRRDIILACELITSLERYAYAKDVRQLKRIVDRLDSRLCSKAKLLMA